VYESRGYFFTKIALILQKKEQHDASDAAVHSRNAVNDSYTVPMSTE
jgi:hypothetical protein